MQHIYLKPYRHRDIKEGHERDEVRENGANGDDRKRKIYAYLNFNTKC